jgi:ABC-type amino acid transport substrate-binding protein
MRSMGWSRGTVITQFITLCCIGSDAVAQHRSASAAAKIASAWTGDFDGMVERNHVRVLLPFSKTFYFLDGGRQRGLTYDMLKAFEAQINADLKRKTLRVHVVFVPVNRDQLIPGLLSGRGDIAAGGLTITPNRQRLVDFSKPLAKNVREIVVTGPDGPAFSSVGDLAGKTIHVRSLKVAPGPGVCAPEITNRLDPGIDRGSLKTTEGDALGVP